MSKTKLFFRNYMSHSRSRTRPGDPPLRAQFFSRLWRCSAAFIFSTTLSGCVSVDLAKQNFEAIPAKSHLVLMPPDIKYYKVTAGGILEPAADWSLQARQSFDQAIDAVVSELSEAVSFERATELEDAALEYDKLHRAIGRTIIDSHFGVQNLRAKRDAATNSYTFDYSLGAGVADLGISSKGDYALFIYFRDYQASAGRVGLAVIGAISGIGVYTGHTEGFASLVDLQTGAIVGFKQVQASAGDMRQPDAATKMMRHMLDGLLNSATD